MARTGSGTARWASHPHVIVTLDLSQKPIGRGLRGWVAWHVGRAGRAVPCRPLTKYRNSKEGGGPRGRGRGTCLEKEAGPPSSPGEVSAPIFIPPTAGAS